MKWTARFFLWILMMSLALMAPNGSTAAGKWRAAVDGEIRGIAAKEPIVFWVLLRASADPEPEGNWEQRGAKVVSDLRQVAESSQVNLRAYLERRGLSYRSFWIANALLIQGDGEALTWMSTRPEVVQVKVDQRVDLINEPGRQTAQPVLNTLNWNLTAIGLPGVWQDYQTQGENIVVATIDTGLAYDHETIRSHYRGYQDGVYTHAYNWFDGMADEIGAEQCLPVGVPCDLDGHGTHVAGIIVGQTADQTLTLGVAPGAKLIAARACDGYGCSQAALLAAGQWLLAPTDQNGLNPRPDLRPHVINNSWGAAGDNLFFKNMVAAWDAAGIFTVAAAGNNGPACGTVRSPASYPLSTAVGAFNESFDLWSFSARGPTTDGRNKPDLSAPGVGVLSAYPPAKTGYALLDGTSMAAPHVAGAVALLWSKFPHMRGNPDLTRWVLAASSDPAAPMGCSTVSANNDFGRGRLDIGDLFSLAQAGLVSFHQYLPSIQHD